MPATGMRGSAGRRARPHRAWPRAPAGATVAAMRNATILDITALHRDLDARIARLDAVAARFDAEKTDALARHTAQMTTPDAATRPDPRAMGRELAESFAAAIVERLPTLADFTAAIRAALPPPTPPGLSAADAARIAAEAATAAVLAALPPPAVGATPPGIIGHGLQVTYGSTVVVPAGLVIPDGLVIPAAGTTVNIGTGTRGWTVVFGPITQTVVSIPGITVPPIYSSQITAITAVP